MRLSPDQFERLSGVFPDMERDPAAVRRRLDMMEHLLEGLIQIPGTQQRLGLDVLLNAIPLVGSAAASLLGTWLLWEARNLGLSRWQFVRMGGNIGIDALLSAIPFLGAIPDFFFRSNTRNLRIIREHLDKHHPASATIEGEVISAKPRS